MALISFFPNSLITFTLCNDPCFVYDLALLCDRGVEPERWTSYRFKFAVLYLESLTERYELACEGSADGSDYDTYRLIRVSEPVLLDNKTLEKAHCCIRVALLLARLLYHSSARSTVPSYIPILTGAISDGLKMAQRCDFVYPLLPSQANRSSTSCTAYVAYSGFRVHTRSVLCPLCPRSSPWRRWSHSNHVLLVLLRGEVGALPKPMARYKSTVSCSHGGEQSVMQRDCCQLNSFS